MKILIIDNDLSTVTTLKALILNKEKIDIDTAVSGKEGLDKMKAMPDYDVVLLDIMMPEISGMDVCKTMTNDWKLSQIPVLLMSSALPIPPDEFHHSLEKFSSLSVVKGVIEKPFVIDELLSKMRQAAKNRL